MFKPLEIFIGLRYLRAKRRNQFISFISFSSMTGVALGVMALITVLSVMNGFENEVRERILGMASHITVSRFDGPVKDWKELGEAVKKSEPRIIGLAPYIRKEAMLSLRGNVSGSLLRGISPELDPEVSEVWEHMTSGQLGDLRSGEFGIILGHSLARSLGAVMGDKVTVVTPQAISTPAGILPRLKRFTVRGVFEIGMHEYDSALALIHIEDAMKLFRTEGGVTGLRLKLDDLYQVVPVRSQLEQQLSAGRYWITDWTQRHANLFRAVKIEKTMMFLMLSLIVAVAAFNIVSTLVMVVTDKQADIAILRTLGITPRSVMAIFMVQGTIIGLVGVLLGTVAGVTLALNLDVLIPWLEGILNVQFMPAEIYYINQFPSDLHWGDVVKIIFISFTLSVLATFYPAWRASRTQPAEALRYE
jgi:lipoprotein-releasing system permease protein